MRNTKIMEETTQTGSFTRVPHLLSYPRLLLQAEVVINTVPWQPMPWHGGHSIKVIKYHSIWKYTPKFFEQIYAQKQSALLFFFELMINTWNFHF